jgi:hypothetical protein
MSPRPFDLLCAICLYTKEDTANRAVTVIRGYAVCDDHLGYVAQGEEWFYILRAAKREEAGTSG